MEVEPRIRLTFSMAGESDIVVEEDRILQIPSQEESSDSQVTKLICQNSDGYFTDLNLKGWDAVLELGLVTEAVEGVEYSTVAPFKVLSQYEPSAPGVLQCHFSLIGIPNLLAEDKASKDYFHHWSDTKKVKAMITEIANGQPVETELIEEQTAYDPEEGVSYINLDDTEVTWFDEDGVEHSSVLHGVGQRLTISERTVTKLAFRLKKTGTPSGTNVTFRIRDADTHDTLASKTFPIASISTSPTWCEVTFDSPVVVDQDVWIYIEHTEGTATEYISVSYTSVAMKPNEHIFRVFAAGEPGAHWETTDEDCFYRYKYTGAGIDCFDHCQAYEVVYDSEDGLIDAYLPKDAFRIYEGQSRLDKINHLLGYTGCEKIVKADGKIHVFVPKSSEPFNSEYSLDEGHTFFSKAIREALVIPNRIVVKSLKTDKAQYSGEATSPVSYALLPITGAPVRTSLVDSDQGTSIAQARISRLEIAAQRGWANVPMNLGAEVFDYDKVTDSRASDSRVGNLGYIRRSYNPRNNEFTMAVSFGRVRIKSVPGTRPSLMPEARAVPEPTLDETVLRWGMIRPIFEKVDKSFDNMELNFDDVWGVEGGESLEILGEVGDVGSISDLWKKLIEVYKRLGWFEGQDIAGEIAQEALSRVNADGTLQGQITVNVGAISLEVTNRTDADTVLSGQITVNADAITLEVSERIDGDVTLQGQITVNADNITLEVTDRTNADGVLQGNIEIEAGRITLEVTDRTNADTTLQGQITVNADNIALNVTEITTLDGRVTTNEASIIVNADAITLEVSDRTDADSALEGEIDANLAKLDDIAADTKITPVEKLTAKKYWDEIVAEKPGLDSEADNIGVSRVNYDNAYTALDTYLNTTLNVFGNMATTTAVVRATWNSKWNDYYEEKIKLLNSMTHENKASIDIEADRITLEVSDRQGADTTLQANITIEADRITTEVTDRTSADTTLQGLITVNADQISLNVTDISSIDGRVTTAEGEISVNADNITLKVSKNNVIAQINISPEEVRIDANRIHISGATTFSSGYDPTTKLAPGDVGDMAYESMVRAAKLDSTVIDGGYLVCALINADDIVAGSLTGITISQAAGNVVIDGTGVHIKGAFLKVYDTEGARRGTITADSVALVLSGYGVGSRVKLVGMLTNVAGWESDIVPYASGGADVGRSLAKWKNIYGTLILATDYYAPLVDGMLTMVGDDTGDIYVYSNGAWRLNASGGGDGGLENTVTVNDVTASRAFNTTYRNTSGKPKLCVVSAKTKVKSSSGGGNSYILAYLGSASPSIKVDQSGCFASSDLLSDIQIYSNVVFKVPPNYYYKVSTSVGALGQTPVLSDWIEYDDH